MQNTNVTDLSDTNDSKAKRKLKTKKLVSFNSPSCPEYSGSYSNIYSIFIYFIIIII